MENTTLSKYTVSFGLSLAVASVSNALLVVVKEKSPAVMSGMQKMTGHHWVTHGAIVLLVFVVFGWILAMPNGGQGMRITACRLIRTLVLGVVLGGVIIVGFYLIGD